VFTGRNDFFGKILAKFRPQKFVKINLLIAIMRAGFTAIFRPTSLGFTLQNMQIKYLLTDTWNKHAINYK